MASLRFSVRDPSISGRAQWWEHWAVGGGDIAGALKLGTRGSCCALIATVHRPGGVLPRSSARHMTERFQLVAEHFRTRSILGDDACPGVRIRMVFPTGRSQR
jgi:hypothetical protein